MDVHIYVTNISTRSSLYVMLCYYSLYIRTYYAF